MIGRGTRLCPNIFGEGKDKELFYIFDWCGNFDYFSENPEGIGSSNSMSLTERLFSLRLDIAKELQSANHQEKEFDKKLHDDLKVLLHQQVRSIVKERKDARPYWGIIEPFRDKDRWTCLSEEDVLKLKEIGKLIPKDSDDESAKKCDVIMLHLQLALINPEVHAGQFKQVVVNIASHLEKKGTVPVVMARINTIRKVQKPQFWEEESLNGLEYVRTELRDLIKLLEDTRKTKKFIIDIDDPYEMVETIGDSVIQTSYKQRVIDYLAKNTDNPTLHKIQNFEQLTSADFAELERIFFEELGTRKEFEELAEGHPYKNNVAAFIRVINGIDRKKALQIYQNFINDSNLTSEQERYLKNILDYVSVNGDIETKSFMEYPLKMNNWRGTFGDHFIQLKNFVKQIHQVISATV
jgi:type I restriction enzyme R subunit